MLVFSLDLVGCIGLVLALVSHVSIYHALFIKLQLDTFCTEIY